jgi:mannose-1-phosphate guanylyltransferase/mannose-6-phosphate isomerase
MDLRHIRPVLLAGGSGTRLWPISRSLFPKQFASLAGEQSLFEQTLARLAALGLSDPIVVGNEKHRFILAEQLRKAGVERPVILLEPEGRNTAGAIALAACAANATDADATLFVLPSDHWIGNIDELARALGVARAAAKAGRIVAFGIEPQSPHTGYGYIRSGAAIAGVEGARAVETFREKPDAATAAKWIAEGGWLWNSGMFFLRAQDALDEIGSSAPEIAMRAAAAFKGAALDGDFVRPEKSAFLAMPSLPFDVAVMEKTSRGAVVPVALDWTDLGDWDAIQSVLPVDNAGNTLVGDVVALDTKNTILRTDGPFLAAIGIENVVVVATDDAVLVTSRDASQDVKEIVARLKREGRSEASIHTSEHRPWGSYRSLAHNDRFRVKEIVVRPGAQLSLQLHRHRAEHWVVVSGVALVTLGSEEKMVHETESIHVPVGTPHRLANPGKIPLRLIEVQTGSYLGEDDIVRIEDRYGRK